jgi:hypothetical protein
MLEKFERVAQSTGFRDPERMRRAFIRAFASRGNRCAARRGRVGRELINPRASADVRSDIHYGLKSEMARGPKGAKIEQNDPKLP